MANPSNVLRQLEQDLLASIPAWEEESGRPFLIHGERVLRILMETASASDQENQRKNAPRPGSVPPRSTTPVNSSNHYVPGSNSYGVSGRGVVTPAVRPGSAMGGTSNKRQRVADGQGGQGRNVLGSHRGGNGHRVVSPTKASNKTPGRSVSRTASKSMSTHMPVPKPGTQHHALGHGRVPSGIPLGMSARNLSSSTTSRGYSGRAPVDSKKAAKMRRESFKPRPSVDDWQHGHGGHWGGYAGPSVKEEDERY
jgi:Ase1/PRC1/MAP65 family protein